ncbi:MAG: glycosyltransferase family 2 protein [Butyrivibrio sp.]|uniref:Dolichol-phosphate mannosyltransferase n=1 Tax=Butyrivibrio hungatei TaxID=185008 RepID=A0A1G5AB92_9FIRM|nr:glycosyltransferase family 2 protein [Butyrivibrio hungatei]MCR4996092.1 glycosyltransferase family 2 protein [Butyrivibrio sp.]SCX75149.1 dolichol-phosphate mannosyltransferase [Butyrivibrio hungatei]
MLSVIIPAYNEEEMIKKTSETISGILDGENIDFELLFINDGSSDNTWKAITEEAARNKRVKGVCFSRNFGKESAVFAGIAEATGDCCVVLDCDLQHPPEKIVEMYRLWEQGYEIVEGVKTSRGKESAMHSFAAKSFYNIMSDAVGFDMSRASDYKLLDRKAMNVLLNMNEKNAFFRALSSWIGFKSTEVTYDVREREAGESKWSTRSLIKYAINNITSFTSAPLHLITISGWIVAILGLGFSVEALYRHFFIGNDQPGFTTVIILICFTAAMIMIGQGIIGIYISKIYDEVKGRPRYIIDKTTYEK